MWQGEKPSLQRSAGPDIKGKSLSGIPEQTVLLMEWGDALLGDRGNCMVKLSCLNLESKLYR